MASETIFDEHYALFHFLKKKLFMQTYLGLFLNSYYARSGVN